MANFTPRKPVAWFSPYQLAGTALRVIMAERFGAFLDKRELQVLFPQSTFRHDAGTELWLDYVADVGDGFDATYSVAWLLAQDHLTIDGLYTPRGEILVLGGDEVYPVGSAQEYRDRCEGPYESALPEGATADPRPKLYALPGNHDWYDGLTAFLRLFGKGEHLGGWDTPQKRSYFGLKLPNGWWLFAIDAQFDAYLDEPQMQYFEALATEFEDGDKVIIAAPTPTWVYERNKPGEYDTIKYFIKKIIGDRDVHVKVQVSGDAHYYARYGEAYITCGGGGAYLAGTHGLHETLFNGEPLGPTYPSKARSKLYGWGVFWRMPLKNPGFLVLLGMLHTLMLLAFVWSSPRVMTLSILGTVALAVGATLGFAVMEAPVRRARNWIAGSLHAVAQFGLALGGLYAWNRLPFVHWTPPLPGLSALILYLPVAGLASALVVALYLLVADRFGINRNELFSGQSIIDHKSFLRMHFAADGSLTIYPIGLAKVCRTWTAELAPGVELVPHLIEEPIKIY